MPDDALEYRVRVADFATMRGHDVAHRLIGQMGRAAGRLAGLDSLQCNAAPCLSRSVEQ
jgi:hypothetical protein